MDGARFDRLTRLLVPRIDRRRALGGAGLFAGLLAIRHGFDLLPAVEAASLCPPAPFLRCTKRPAKAFAAATTRCRPHCVVPKSKACRTCLNEPLAEILEAARACADKVCRGGPATDPDTGVARAAALGQRPAAADPQRQRAASPQPCQNKALWTCVDRKERDTNDCLLAAAVGCSGGVAACAAAVAFCLRGYANGLADCHADSGCPGGGYCTRENLCCPFPLDSGCGGTCCDFQACERCVDGTCRGCAPNVEICSVPYPAAAHCRCADGAERCGDRCCDASKCERCEGGVCVSAGVPCGAACCDTGGTCCNPEQNLCCYPGQECCNGICYATYKGPHTPCDTFCCPAERVCCPSRTGQGMVCSDTCS